MYRPNNINLILLYIFTTNYSVICKIILIQIILKYLIKVNNLYKKIHIIFLYFKMDINE
jgi:hypothetical protein